MSAGADAGPLAQLQSIGTIILNGNPAQTKEDVDRLRGVLWSRGCRRSMTHLTLLLDFRDIDSSVLPVVQSLEQLHEACCRPDAPFIFEEDSPSAANANSMHLSLSLFYGDDFPRNPSALFKQTIQQLARQANEIYFAMAQHEINNTVDNPSKAAIDVASSLSFERAERVTVCVFTYPPPPPTTPCPHPAIIDHLRPFPKATQLDITGRLAATAGRLLAARMATQVAKVTISGFPTGEALGIVGELGSERVVEEVSIHRGSPRQVSFPLAADLPTISQLCFSAHVLSGDVQAEFPSALSGLFQHVPGLQRVALSFDNHSPAAIHSAFPDGSTIGHFPVTVEERSGCPVVMVSRDAS
ncbi:unnamed protein product [Vitrella brassicaformis CCMP3155]|uniref:Uncharacterized protein n=2 Tax=Vitrella brassicaformis TaxID=1169539 RepID=A0A0G4EIX6_VITBC|nr:unnamed protein product [Vitrella brassicaformis CCMP3155]|eukprot:CEL95949.1 unnamed protein product [Vitrella brassicaformis CCMP3155]